MYADVRKEIGQLLATRGVAELMETDSYFKREITNAFVRYTKQDWGSISEEDWEMNDFSWKNGERTLAAYETSHGKIFIITECDRSATTILFPDEY